MTTETKTKPNGLGIAGLILTGLSFAAFMFPSPISFGASFYTQIPEFLRYFFETLPPDFTDITLILGYLAAVLLIPAFILAFVLYFVRRSTFMFLVFAGLSLADGLLLCLTIIGLDNGFDAAGLFKEFLLVHLLMASGGFLVFLSNRITSTAPPTGN